MKWNQHTLEALYPPIRLIDKHQAALILGISPSTLKQYRLDENSTLIENVHYVRWNSRTIRYVEEMITNWGMNRNNPHAHQQAIEAFLMRLSHHQSTTGRRKKSK